MRSLLLFIALFFHASHVQAQVLVHEEPRHRLVFQNDRIRILNVLLPPGDTTQYHIHRTPSLFLFFTGTTTGSQLKGAAALFGRSTAGTILFENLAPPHVRVHRVWNTDRDTFHVMDIELLSKDSGFTQEPLVLPHLQLVVDTPWARVYRLTLNAENSFALTNAKRFFVFVSLDAAAVQMQQGGKTELQTVQPGSFFFIPIGQAFMLKNTGSVTVHFALLELPGP